MIRLIPLSQGQSAIVDDADFDWLSQFSWYAHRRPCTFYAERKETVAGVSTKVWMHRLILGTPAGLFVDHIDGNGLNNTRANLRSVSHQDNMINRAMWRKGTTSGIRGVYLDKRDGKWFSSITVNKRLHYLGRFDCPSDASAAYEAARAEMLGGKIYRTEGVK